MFKFRNNFSQLANLSSRTMVIAAAAVILLGVIAYASIPDSNGVIHGCYKKSGGTLRLIDDPTAQCDSRAEMLISWNQTGPQGPQGPAGPQGPQGPQGPAGYSLATRATGSATMPPGQYTQILSRDLPAGNWVISARATVGMDQQSYEPAIIVITCELRSGDTVIGAAQDWGTEETQLISKTLPLNGLATLSGAGTVSVWCVERNSERSFIGGGSSEMTIIQVGDVF